MPAGKATWLHWLLEGKGKGCFSDKSRGSAWHKTSAAVGPEGSGGHTWIWPLSWGRSKGGQPLPRPGAIVVGLSQHSYGPPDLVLVIWFRLGKGPSSGQGR